MRTVEVQLKYMWGQEYSFERTFGGGENGCRIEIWYKGKRISYVFERRGNSLFGSYEKDLRNTHKKARAKVIAAVQQYFISKRVRETETDIFNRVRGEFKTEILSVEVVD